MINKETTKTKEIKLDQRFFEEDTFKVEKTIYGIIKDNRNGE